MPAPRKLQRGEPITEAWLAELCDAIDANELRSGKSYRIIRHPNGGYSLDIRIPRQPSAAAAAQRLPFELYQDPTATGSAATRTFRVHRGYVSGVAPDNDDAAASPISIVVPDATNIYKIWLQVTSTVTGNQLPSVSAVTIDHGATGWTDYPDQPESDPDTGAPPTTTYILIALVTTTSTVTVDQIVRNNLLLTQVMSDLTYDATSGGLLAVRAIVPRAT